MLKKLTAFIPSLVILGVGIYSLEQVTSSRVFGVLAYSIAIGAVIFFAFIAPFGTKEHFLVFGTPSHYRGGPKAIIPAKIVAVLISAIVISCITGMALYHYGY